MICGKCIVLTIIEHFLPLRHGTQNLAYTVIFSLILKKHSKLSVVTLTDKMGKIRNIKAKRFTSATQLEIGKGC